MVSGCPHAAPARDDTAHQLSDVTVVADAGMISEANQKAIFAARLSFTLVRSSHAMPSL